MGGMPDTILPKVNRQVMCLYNFIFIIISSIAAPGYTKYQITCCVRGIQLRLWEHKNIEIWHLVFEIVNLGK